MYFSNIGDTELAQYHEQVKTNFSIGLSTIISSNLFKVETIKADSIYKIYPLFYCETIESSNPIDKILDNKCIICNKQNDTFLTFRTPLKEVDLSNVSFGYDFIDIQEGITIYCYDKNTGNPLSDVNIKGTTKYGSLQEDFTGVTDNNGLFYTTFNLEVGYVSYLKLSYDGIDYLVRGED